ncbi:MAG: HDIG domain-containing protein [Sedimentisphaerales bacterium]|nr:HDIG domain-containing protein [Sedimentisphaerales bacterium]
MPLLKKINPRRSRLRKSMFTERFSQADSIVNTDSIISFSLLFLFIFLMVGILAYHQTTYYKVLPVIITVTLISIAGALYIYHYQKRMLRSHMRVVILIILFLLLLISNKLIASELISLKTKYTPMPWATGTAVIVAIVLTIAYDQRFAIGMSIFYCIFACLAAEPVETGSQYQLLNIDLFLIMMTGAFTCSLSLKEIRTRIKLLQVSALAAVLVFIMALSLELFNSDIAVTAALVNAGLHAGVTMAVGLVIQSLLPLIEKTFHIVTSMTLLDYSDANQPLLKKLAMEAPGTFSHSLLIGSVAEAAAESIGRNGLLCRVGAYYHDIGKLNKADYFIENEIGSGSRHKELAPTMSLLIIIGHVKDGIEMAREYGLPKVLRQFIETHHGTTLVEHFYNEAKKLNKKKSKGKSIDEPFESEFRYPGPKPRTKEAAIIMLADTVEGAVRSLQEITPTKIDTVVHNMAMRRLQDGQFDECDMSLRELSQIETSISKTLAAHYHSRIAYPKAPDEPFETLPISHKNT